MIDELRSRGTSSATESIPIRWTLPNKITVLRIVLVPVFVATYVAFRPDYPGLFIPLFVFIVAIASDGLDGYIARSWNQRSELGTLLDPIADKLLIMSSLVILCFLGPRGAIPMWLVTAVLSRDLLLLTGGILAGSLRGKLVVRPSRTGKLATVFMMSSIVWGMTLFYQYAPEWCSLLLWRTTALLVLASGIGYGVQGCRQVADPGPGGKEDARDP